MIHSENVNKLLSSVKTVDDGYRALASAIIIQAADDYRKAKLNKNKLRMESVEHFFKSDLYGLLSGGLDGGYIMRLLREEDTASLRRNYGTFQLD